MPLLELEGVRKAYGGVEVLGGVDLEADAGEVLAIAGEAYQQATGSELPESDVPVVRPDPAQLWDFDDEEEMGRRLPTLSALFLEPPE
jgi:hypothetical protein